MYTFQLQELISIILDLKEQNRKKLGRKITKPKRTIDFTK